MSDTSEIESPGERSGQQGIQSVEVAAPLLRSLAESGNALPLSSLARLAGMPAAKAHRYLVSLIRVGLVEQHPQTGEYDLGSLALELGLAALGRMDDVQLADASLARLREATGETVALAAWGNMGPTYIRLLQSRRPVTVNLQIGSVMPLSYTATGLCFASFMDPVEVTARLEAELDHNRHTESSAPKNLEELGPLLDQTRLHGLARVLGHLDPSLVRKRATREVELLLAGFNAFSAPVYDHLGAMRFALTVVGSAAQISDAWDGDVALATLAEARALSRRLGYRQA